MRTLFITVMVAALCAISATAALAAPNPNATGQPNQTCTSPTALNEPGRAALAPGSAFNETRPGTAGTVYAGNGANTNTPANANAVSQYDVACYQVSQSH